MKAVAIIALCVVAVAAQRLSTLDAAEPVGPTLLRIAHKVNAAKTSWKAGHNERWNSWNVKDIKRIMGVKYNQNIVLNSRAPFTAEQIASTPKSLDLRKRLFNNSTCVGPILDQGKCGSCWAFGAAEAISDRLCMKSSGTFLQLAALDLVTCDQNDGGCEGGDPASAWSYAGNGLATEKCIPYLTANGGPIPTCDPSQEPCLDFVNTPSCPSQCNDGSSINRGQGAVSNVYNIGSVQDMMTEVDQNGSFEVAFSVYADFLTYKTGVYVYTTGDYLGGHAVKLIGYGTENGVDYWLCQNSWTTTWGDGGYFKIRRGTDECGIEDDAVAGTLG